MLLEANVVGKKTDWANYITLADEHETPLLRILPKGPKPVNVVKHYQVDAYDTPSVNAWPDGKDWDTFKSAGANRAELTARVQWFVKTAAVSKLAEDVTDTAGITDELAHEIPKKMTELARDMEAAAGSDQAEYVDDGKTGNKFRGIGQWVQSTAQTTGLPVPTAYLPPATSIYSDVKANLYEDQMRLMLESMWTQTGSSGRKIGVCGSKLKKRFREFQDWSAYSTTTQSTARVTYKDQDDSTLGNTIDYYDSDWGMIELHMSRWLNLASLGASSATAYQWRGYFLNGNRWAWLWNQKPTVYKPEFKGGGYKAAIDAILMLLCWNPIGEGKVNPSDA